MKTTNFLLSNLITIGLILLNYISIAQHGTDPQWGNDIELPDPAGGTTIRGVLYSNIATFSNNKRVVLLEKTDNPIGHYLTTSYDGINWSTPVSFAPAAVIGLNSPKIVADKNDNLHIVWASQSPKALFYSKMDSALNLVIDSARIAERPDFNSFKGVYLTVDTKSRIHVMWHEGDINTVGDSTECYYSQSTNGGNTWLPKQLLSINDGKNSAFPRGQYNAYDGDTLAIFWRNFVTTVPDNWDIKMVLSYNAGISWTAPTIINSSTNFQGDPDLVIDPNRRLHLFYHDAPQNDSYWGIRVVYGYSDDWGATWSPSNNFSNNPVSQSQRSYLVEGSRYDVQNDVLWSFWKEETLLALKEGDMMCTYSLDRGVSWSTPEYITDRDSTSIGFKAVTLLPNGGLAINYELPNYPSSGNMRVFYKERNPIASSVQNNNINGADIDLYPNPSSNKITVNFNDLAVKSVKVFNLSGQLVFQKSIQNNQNQYLLNIKPFAKGVYFVKVIAIDAIFTQKIIKK